MAVTVGLFILIINFNSVSLLNNESAFVYNIVMFCILFSLLFSVDLI